LVVVINEQRKANENETGRMLKILAWRRWGRAEDDTAFHGEPATLRVHGRLEYNVRSVAISRSVSFIIPWNPRSPALESRRAITIHKSSRMPSFTRNAEKEGAHWKLIEHGCIIVEYSYMTFLRAKIAYVQNRMRRVRHE
jgi:hypothetical protein